MVTPNRFEELLSKLGRDFDQMVLEDPAFSQEILANTQVVFRLHIDRQRFEGSIPPGLHAEVNAFNRWSMELAKANHEPGQSLLKVTLHIYRIAPARKQGTACITARTLDQAVRWVVHCKSRPRRGCASAGISQN